MMPSILEMRGAAVKPLIIDDEKLAREQLARFLRNRGFDVVEAQSGELGIRFAEERAFEVVLIDIQMREGEIDGIDTAQEIQRSHPHTSVIFVTAYVDDPVYRERVQEAGLRIAGWIEKPVMKHLEELVRLIEKEAAKSRVRKAIAAAESEGIEPHDHLRSLADGWPEVDAVVIQELREELDDRSNMDIEAQIGHIYNRICDLSLGSSELEARTAKIDSLVRQLRDLQHREADRIERRFNAQLLIKPGEGYTAMREAEKFLEKQE